MWPPSRPNTRTIPRAFSERATCSAALCASAMRSPLRELPAEPARPSGAAGSTAWPVTGDSTATSGRRGGLAPRLLATVLAVDALDPVDQVLRRGFGVEDVADAEGLELRDVVFLDHAAADHDDVVDLALHQQLHDAREDGHVRAGEDAHADDVDVLLDRGVHDHLGRLVQTRVDDFHPRVAERAGDDLRAAV